MWEEFADAALELTKKIEAFTGSYTKIVPYMSKLGTPQDVDSMRQELHKLCHANEESAKQIRDDVKRLYQLVTSSERSLEEKREYRLQAGRLLDDFLSKLVQFQRIQRDIVDHERNAFVRARTARLSLRHCDDRPVPFSQPTTGTGLTLPDHQDLAAPLRRSSVNPASEQRK